MRQSAAKLPKKEKEIEMGLIYMIFLPNGKKYIGQHKNNNLEERKKTHKYQFNSFCNKKESLKNVRIDNANPNGFCSALYNAFNKYGIDKCEWSVIENNIPLESINDIENTYIIKHKTMSPNGYNLKLNGGSEYATFSDQTIKKMSESQSKVFNTKLHKYRKYNKELEGLPKHVNFVNNANGKKGYRITNRPNCYSKSKSFTSETVSIEELKKKVITFLEEIEGKTIEEILNDEKGINEENIKNEIVVKKTKRDLPVGIRYYKDGYKAIFVRNKISHSKSFIDKSITKEENLNLVINWYNTTKLEDVFVERELPTGVSIYKDGYKARIRHKNKVYAEYFRDKTISDEESIKLAVDWLIMTKLKILQIKSEERPETK